MRNNIIVLSFISWCFSSGTVAAANEELHPILPLVHDSLSRRISPAIAGAAFTTCRDTLVFTPSAFYLTTDSRLNELLRQFPGIHQEKGQLYWLDQPLTVTVNQNTVFNSNGNIGRIPCGIIQELQLYNNASDLKARSGNDDQEEDYTLNVKLLPESERRWFNSLHGAYQTPRRYDIGGEVIRLDQDTPWILFVNANDQNRLLSANDFLNEHSTVGPYGRQQIAALSFQQNWKTPAPEALANRGVCNTDLQHDVAWGNPFLYQETYFLDGTTHYQLADKEQHTHRWAPSFFGELKWNLDSRSALKIQGEATYLKTEVTTLTEEAQLKSPPFNWSLRPLQDIFTDSAPSPIHRQVISRDLSQSNTWGHHSRFRCFAEWNRLLTDQSQLFLNGELLYTDQIEKEESNFQIDLGTETAANNSQHYDDHPTHQFTASLQLFYKGWISRHLLFSFTYQFSHMRRKEQEAHYQSTEEDFHREELLGQLDETNSFRHTDQLNRHRWSGALVFNCGPFSVKPSLNGFSDREEARHLRTTLDTLVRRNSFTWQPMLEICWQRTPQLVSKLEYAYTTERPRLFNTLPWRDTTHPVYRFEGNKDLHASYLHTVRWSLHGALPWRQLIYGADIQLHHNSSPVTQAYAYDQTTCSFTARPQNALHPTFALTCRLKLQQYLSPHWQYRTVLIYDMKNRDGYLTGAPDDEQLLSNRQHIAETTIAPQLTYEDRSDFKCTFYSDLVFTRNRYKIYKRNYHPLRQYNYGCKIEKRLGDFHFCSDLHDLIYKGYINPQINGHHVLWSASAAWYCCQGKGTLRMTCDDLLNQTLLYSRTIEPHQHTECYQDKTHHYLLLSFTYRFFSTPRKSDNGLRKIK